MTLKVYDFEGKTQGTAVTTTTEPTLNTVSLNGGSIIYDSGSAWGGGFGIKCTNSTAGTIVRAVPQASNLTMSVGGSFYYGATPTSTALTVMSFRNAAVACRISVSTANVLQLGDSSGTNLKTIATVAANTKYWISCAFTTTSTANTGTYNITLYNSSGTSLATISGTAYSLGTAAFDGGDFGVQSSTSPSGSIVGWDKISFNDGSTAGIAVASTNQAPTANAGPAQTVDAWDTVTLDGTASADIDGTVASYAWTQTSGTATTLTGVTTANPTFTAQGLDAGDTLVFRLIVTDNLGASSAASTVTITVRPANTFIAGGASGSIWIPVQTVYL